MMEANIREDGSLIIEPGNETEAYALTHWALVNANSEISLHLARTLEGNCLTVRPVPTAETFTPQGFSIKGEEK